MKYIILILLVVSTSAFGSRGGLDSMGGHTNRKTGEYHCHRDPCNAAQKQVQEATDNPAGSFSLVYNRKDWKHWIDVDGDCQNTRAEVLIRDAIHVNSACTIRTGKWLDPYSGKEWTLASDLDIDHVIPLSWAHKHGAANWSKRQKKEYANDMANLLAVEDNLNQSKGGKGPDEWMPPNVGYHCQYLFSWQNIIDKYSLTMTMLELAWFAPKLEECEIK